MREHSLGKGVLYLCGAEVARGGKTHAGKHEVSRAALPPAFLLWGGMQREG